MSDIEGSKSCGNARKYTAAPTTASAGGPNHATRNHGNDFLNPRGLMTLFLNPSRVMRRVISTPMAGKTIAPPVTNCAATGGMPTSAPDETGYTTPNSYAHVRKNVTPKKIKMRFIVPPRFRSARPRVVRLWYASSLLLAFATEMRFT